MGFGLDILAEIEKIARIDERHESERNIREVPEDFRFSNRAEEGYERKQDEIEGVYHAVFRKKGECGFSVIRPTDKGCENEKENAEWQKEVCDFAKHLRKRRPNEFVALKRGVVLSCDEKHKPRCCAKDDGIEKHLDHTEHSLFDTTFGGRGGVGDGGCATACLVGDKSFGKADFDGVENTRATHTADDGF